MCIRKARQCWLMLAPKMRNIHLLQSLLAKEQQLQVGEVPFLIYELEDEDAIGAFGKLPPVVPRIARMRVRGGYVQMMASCPLVTSCWEWSGSSVRIAFGSVECKGWDYYCLYGPTITKKLEHEWKHHDLPRLPKDGDVPFHGEFLYVFISSKVHLPGVTGSLQ